MDVATALGLFALAAMVGTYGTVIGAGGGFVLIPGMVLLFGFEGVEAVGTGAVALAVIGATGAAAYDKQGLVARPVAGWFALGAVVLSWAGWVSLRAIATHVIEERQQQQYEQLREDIAEVKELLKN